MGWGHFLPENRIPNDYFSTYLDTSDDWITSRTGIKHRHFASPHEFTSDLAAKAAQNALVKAGMDAQQIDLIIVATTTPDTPFPAAATQVQAKIDAKNAYAYDVNGVCSGFLVALDAADAALKIGRARTALVIGSETFSRLLDMQDRSTCVLFGDGAGAIILQAEEDSSQGICDIILHSDGHLRPILYAERCLTDSGQTGKTCMVGPEVFRHAVKKLEAVSLEILGKHRLSPKDLQWVIPHQANLRIIEGLAKKLKVDNTRVIRTITEHANTSAASIPLALSKSAHRFQKGDRILLNAIGGGMIWGAGLLRW